LTAFVHSDLGEMRTGFQPATSFALARAVDFWPMEPQALYCDLFNAALKKGGFDGIRMKVSEKGAVSVYGMDAFQ
jgi:hypothetical protein